MVVFGRESEVEDMRSFDRMNVIRNEPDGANVFLCIEWSRNSGCYLNLAGLGVAEMHNC